MAEVIRYVDPDASGAGDGTSWTDAYTSLSAWESGEQTDLVTDGDWHHVYVRSSSGTNDTTQVNVSGWTTDADHYIVIEAADDDKASTVWDDSKYVLDYGSTGYALTLAQQYTVVIGLQIKNDTVNGSCVTATSDHCRVEKCFVDGGGTGGNGIYMDADYSVVVNSVAVGNGWSGIRLSGTAINDSVIYNCTAINNGDGIRVEQYRSQALTNCYAGSNTTDYNCGVNRDPVWTTCYSEDGTGTTTTSACSTSSGVYFTNVTSGSEDVSTTADSDLIDAGTDLSSDGVYSFSDDIDGTTRSSWDVGVYEYASAGGVTIPVFLHHYKIAGGL